MIFFFLCSSRLLRRPQRRDVRLRVRRGPHVPADPHGVVELRRGRNPAQRNRRVQLQRLLGAAIRGSLLLRVSGPRSQRLELRASDDQRRASVEHQGNRYCDQL